MEAQTMAESVMADVYGDWAQEGWTPKPLPMGEAGASPSGQRRYLWTDAFGVLNLVALAEQQPGTPKAQGALAAARALVEAVHECLGVPRSADFPMRLADDGSGFEGLRIGKVKARAASDTGMEFDGMYWHYLDKWIFALARYARAAGDVAAVQRGIRLVRQVCGLCPAAYLLQSAARGRFLARGAEGKPLGLYWKMNVDLTTIPGRDRTGPSGDAVAGLIAYTLLEQAREALGVEGSLTEEMADLKAVVQRFAIRGGFMMASDDPLGYGLQYWETQFFEPRLVDGLQRELAGLASEVVHRRHFDLPFRLYGAIIGARLGGDEAVAQQAEALLESLASVEMSTACGQTPHSGINKVMFATALNPAAFKRRADEAVIVL